MTRGPVSALLRAALVPLLAATPLSAQEAPACPVERASFREIEGDAVLRFAPAAASATVTHNFTVAVEGMVLDGIVQQSDSAARPVATLFHQCPEGDVTGTEIAACTVWEGVVYVVDDGGTIDLLPPEGGEAPRRVLLPDLGPALVAFPALAAALARKGAPWDVFERVGCGG